MSPAKGENSLRSRAWRSTSSMWRCCAVSTSTSAKGRRGGGHRAVRLRQIHVLRCLNLLEEPTGGQIVFEGVDITSKETKIDQMRQKIGMVFQQFNLFHQHDGAGQRERGAGAGKRNEERRGPQAGPELCWSAWDWATAAARIPSSSPAASSSVWPLPARWPCSRT